MSHARLHWRAADPIGVTVRGGDLDISGVPMIDTQVAQHLLRTAGGWSDGHNEHHVRRPTRDRQSGWCIWVSTSDSWFFPRHAAVTPWQLALKLLSERSGHFERAEVLRRSGAR